MTRITTLIRTFTIAMAIAASAITIAPRPAAAYQIDCAILLCLAGGFPPSEPCARARAEMIRRITPWPIEPPLQLWRCPMRAEFPSLPDDETRPVEAAFEVRLPYLQRPHVDTLNRIWKAFGEDVTDYVMAIKVYDLTYRRNRSRDGDCTEWGTLRMGTYDRDWDFSWRRVPHSTSPEWLFDTSTDSCSSVWFRGIGMEWRDHEGSKGTEVVKY